MPASIIPETLVTASRLAVAGLVGLGVGIERERSGHTVGPHQHFAGARTFLLLGVLGGLGGAFIAADIALVGAVLVAAGAGLIVVAYHAASRHESTHVIDGTTETAALVVLALGALAGGGGLRIASGLGAIVVLALAEKERLHGWVERLDPAEMRAALQFSVLALVVLPLLPASIATPVGEVTPRSTWIFVLIISALNFVGHIARRLVGRERGYAVTGALGGLVSSTAVTWGFSRDSRDEASLRPAYAAGVIAASTVLFPRVLVVMTLLNPRVALEAAPLFGAPFIVGVALSWWAARESVSSAAVVREEPRNPLRLGAALQMAIAFQLVLLLMAFVRTQFGDAGTYTTAALFGSTDVDALTVAMTRMDNGFAPVAARAIAVAVASNTLMKAVIAGTIGRGVYRTRATLALLAMLAALLAGFVIRPI
jgi:uncharacterized membrane protein (DUF4010 family)